MSYPSDGVGLGHININTGKCFALILHHSNSFMIKRPSDRCMYTRHNLTFFPDYCFCCHPMMGTGSDLYFECPFKLV